MIRKFIHGVILATFFAGFFAACRHGEPVLPSTGTQVGSGETGAVKGFFLLNEGNMGSNKATLDYYDYETGLYTRNIFPERNPYVTRELGDVGNDIQIYGDKLYAVINNSNLVVVMNAATAKQIAQISIPNCRYIVFSDGYAYVSSYAGPVELDSDSRLGYVAKIDTVSLSVVGECTVGYQPEEMAVAQGKLYVANSGGYRAPNYDRTVSVIDLGTFTETKKIDVAINLHRMARDNHGNIYVSSRGDYADVASKTYIIDSGTDKVTAALHLLPCSDMALAGDSLYVYSTQWNKATGQNTVTYAILDVRTRQVVTRGFIKDGTEGQIKVPYGIAVNPDNGDIFITDAGDYVTPGTLYCFGKDGVKKWSVTTGDIPAHLAFTHEKLQPVSTLKNLFR